MSGLSPMMKQYFDIKAQYPDCILFFRLGDFYEMFFEDAKKISKELELTLTGRDCGLEERAPMCGVPYHACEAYLKRLLDKGYKIAICEQTEDPALAKGLVKRDVVRVVTPGTLIENALLNEEKNNYIASCVLETGALSICFADVSTGDTHMFCSQTDKPAEVIIDALSRFTPTEMLVSAGFLDYPEIGRFMKQRLSCVLNIYDQADLEESSCRATVTAHFADQADMTDILGNPLAVKTLGGLLSYLNSTRKNGAQRITHVALEEENRYMTLDMTTRRNLELTQTMRNHEKKGSLLFVLDKTRTAMGKRYIRNAVEQPLLRPTEILARQTAVQELFASHGRREEIAENLDGVYDLERLMTRVIYNSAGPRDLKALAQTLSKLPVLRQLTSSCQAGYLCQITREIHPLSEVYARIEAAIVDEPPFLLKDGGVIRPGYHAGLDELREISENAKDYIAKIEENERNLTGIPKLKVGYNRVFGYYLEVTNSYRDQVPDRYIRKQTLANCERYITQELKELEGRVLSAADRIAALESLLFDEVRSFVASHAEALQETAAAVARLDFILSLATVAFENQYVCPTIVTDGSIHIQGGRHPVVEKVATDSLFVPNDTLMDEGANRMLILTGPNMAGKSTYMRQTALITIMAQIGSFVPATSARISVCDRVFTRVGASDDLAAGQSTFMVEMSELAEILKHATRHSLVILDEIGRGTSTYDGMSIAKAVVQYLVEHKGLGCKTLFATHYHELTALADTLEGVKNYNIAVKKRGDDIIFLRKIVPGGTDDSFGIEVAKLAGVPGAVVERAKKILKELESGVRTVPVSTASADDQISFADNTGAQLLEALQQLQPETLTPLEALQILYGWKKEYGLPQ